MTDREFIINIIKENGYCAHKIERGNTFCYSCMFFNFCYNVNEDYDKIIKKIYNLDTLSFVEAIQRVTCKLLYDRAVVTYIELYGEEDLMEVLL